MGDGFQYAVRAPEGTVHVVYDSLPAARAALYAMPAPVAKHPRLVKRRIDDPGEPWCVVEVDELL